MKCLYCKKFHTTLKRIKTEDGIVSVCGKHHVASDTESCEDFELYPIIHCPHKGKFKQITITVCIHKQNTGKCKCKKGHEIKRYIDMKPTKIVRRTHATEQPETKLIRRRIRSSQS